MSTPRASRRALILDFDGVIVETELLHFECWNAAFDELHNVRVAGDHRQLVGLSLAQIYALWRNSHPDSPLALSAADEAALLARKTELYFERGAETLRPIPGVVDLIRRAHDGGWYVAVASRARRLRLLRTLALLKLPPLFDIVLGSEDLVDPRTDHKRHARAATPFAIPPKRCLVIEDSASGVRDARADGIGCVIGLTTSLSHQKLLSAGAHMTIERFDDVRLEALITAE